MALNKTVVILALNALVMAFVTKQSKAFDPIVETGVSEISPQGRHVGVNVPPFYWLKLDTRGEHRGVKMDESILEGLVRVTLDRTRDEATGKVTGPIKVKVGGITVYDNTHSTLTSMPSVPSMPSMPSMPSVPSLSSAEEAIESRALNFRDRLRSML